MKRLVNFLLIATICLTTICTISCKQVNPPTPNKQLTEKIIGKWKCTSVKIDTYQNGYLINSENEIYRMSTVDVFNTDGTWADYTSMYELDDPSDPANADQVVCIKGTFIIVDSVLTCNYDNEVFNAIDGSSSKQEVHTIVTLTNSSLRLRTDLKDGENIRKVTADYKRIN